MVTPKNIAKKKAAQRSEEWLLCMCNLSHYFFYIFHCCWRPLKLYTINPPDLFHTVKYITLADVMLIEEPFDFHRSLSPFQRKLHTKSY